MRTMSAGILPEGHEDTQCADLLASDVGYRV